MKNFQIHFIIITDFFFLQLDEAIAGELEHRLAPIIFIPIKNVIFRVYCYIKSL